MASRKEYLDRFKKIRAKRIAKRAGKDLIFDEDAMVGHLAQDEVPACMQHCVLQVRKKMSGSDKEKYISSYNICAAVFQKHGYMKKNSLKLTAKGKTNNTRHMREKEAGKKRGQFITLTRRLWRTSIVQFMKDKSNRTRADKKRMA